eukprot:scaffold36868_cov43-Prasinocladus_malaysianus.AAC.2
MVAPAITRVTLLRNTVNDVSTSTPFDVTTEMLTSVTPTFDGTAITYEGGNVLRSGLNPGTTYYYWLEVEDQAGSVSDQALGRITTAAPVPEPDVTKAASFGTSTCLESTGNNVYASQTGTFSMWVKLDGVGDEKILFSTFQDFNSEGQIHIGKDDADGRIKVLRRLTTTAGV